MTSAINAKLSRHTVHGSRSICTDPDFERLRSRGYKMDFHRGYAGRYDCLGFYSFLTFIYRSVAMMKDGNASC